jgi:hypothetical protein
VRLAALGLALVLASMASAKASDLSFGPFWIRSDHPDLIYLDGDIGPDTYDDFDKARRAAPDATTLILNSAGGSVDQSIRIARDVRANDLHTYVPLRRGCYSACAYIYFAGVNRRASGQLGVHQISDPEFTATSLQHRLAELLDLFHDLGVDAQITSHMLRTPPEALYILDRREMLVLHADSDAAGRLDAMDDRFGRLPVDWTDDDTGNCATIGGDAGWSGGCVPSEWIPTAPNAGESYFFQNSDHQMGLMILDDPGAWTRDALREVVLQAALEQPTVEFRAPQEMTWPAAGVTFDLMVYPGRFNGADVVYQHFYRALPQGALQVLIYSAAGQAWQATSKIAQLFSQLGLDDAPLMPATATPDREKQVAELQAETSGSAAR